MTGRQVRRQATRWEAGRPALRARAGDAPRLRPAPDNGGYARAWSLVSAHRPGPGCSSCPAWGVAELQLQDRHVAKLLTHRRSCHC